ncbi:MAG: hypothetical protein PHI79_02815 [Sulfurovaceae bacterium]|nr:hypothetical protein [Sulfurovaceae bacterium]MDD5548511.1 hypothetical protein [Sulfurovaceae bacterium]
MLKNTDTSPDAIMFFDEEYASKPIEYEFPNEYKIFKKIVASFDVGFEINLTFLKEATTPILYCGGRLKRLMPCAATSQNIDNVGRYGKDALKTISSSLFFSTIESINISGGSCGS